MILIYLFSLIVFALVFLLPLGVVIGAILYIFYPETFSDIKYSVVKNVKYYLFKPFRFIAFRFFRRLYFKNVQKHGLESDTAKYFLKKTNRYASIPQIMAVWHYADLLQKDKDYISSLKEN